MRLAVTGAIVRDWQIEDAPALAAAANNRQIWLTLRDQMPHPKA